MDERMDGSNTPGLRYYNSIVGYGQHYTATLAREPRVCELLVIGISLCV